MKELIKIASNGQWTLEKSLADPMKPKHQNSPEEQAKIDTFINRKAKGQATHETQGGGTKGHLPPAMAGTFHGQGQTTSGKIINKRVAYQNKNTGEMGYGSHPQQEKHLWSWDHHNKKWNHIKTTYGSPIIGR